MKVLGLSSVLAVGLAAVAFASHVNPVQYGDEEGEESNPSCAFLNSSWNEVKVNQAPNGEYPDSGGGDNPGGDGPLVFTVKNSDGKVFDWESNIGIDAVVVKGGNRGSNVYFYDPEETSDTGLHSPDNSKGNRPAISHISACYDTESEEGQPEEQEEPNQPEEQEEPGDEGEQPNQRPSDPDEPENDPQEESEEEPQDEGDEPQGDEPADDEPGGGNERPSDPEEPRDEGGTENTGEEDEESEGDVEGISETQEDEADDDVAEETSPGSADDDPDDDLPFTGAPLGALLLIGLGLLFAGATGRAVLRD